MIQPPFRVIDVDTYDVIAQREPLDTVHDAFARGDRYVKRHPSKDYRVLDATSTPVLRARYRLAQRKEQTT